MFRILQLSDAHIVADRSQAYRNIHTFSYLEAVIEHVLDSRVKPDLIILTGDNSQDGSKASYDNIKTLLSKFNCEVLALPGNHDDTDELRAQWQGDNFNPSRYFAWQNWRLVLLDSTAPGLDDGFLAKSDFDFLEKCMVESRQNPVLLFMHHPPILMGAKYIDDLTILNREVFLTRLMQYPQVKAVFFGHAHQELEKVEQGLTFYCAPSACVQFKPNVDEFTIDEEQSAGYRWIELHEDGTFKTKVIRLPKSQTRW